jgi:hypothetical protein
LVQQQHPKSTSTSSSSTTTTASRSTSSSSKLPSEVIYVDDDDDNVPQSQNGFEVGEKEKRKEMETEDNHLHHNGKKQKIIEGDQPCVMVEEENMVSTMAETASFEQKKEAEKMDFAIGW